MKKFLLIVILILIFSVVQVRALAGEQTNEPDFVSYMKTLQKDIKANWKPPKADENIRVVAQFKINKNGKLSDLKLIKSSVNEEMNNAALEAINKTAPFKPLPEEFTGKSVTIQFSLDYNVKCTHSMCRP
ncbi:MAG: TonB C-terminal domain-containing protein [Heliobacteriaceae bacterium]|jgi:TonB family protein|nr:TonB C-terminal domain-containing protein [Heliobacteriaceae bacterium]